MGCNFSILECSYSDLDSFNSPLKIRIKCADAEISSRRHILNCMSYSSFVEQSFAIIT